MKRHPALVPLSHDHHRALVAARRLRRAADAPDAARSEAAAAFLRFFAEDTIPHFREEEEQLFPSVVEFEETRELLVEALVEHQRLHGLAARLRHAAANGEHPAEVMRELAVLLESHVRGEERRLFPLIERLLQDAGDPVDVGPDDAQAPPGPRPGGGALVSAELNVTPLAWPAGRGPEEHVNEERDVLVVVLEGSALVTVDGEERELGRGEATIVDRGRQRKITAGPNGVRYLSVHRRRPGLQVGRPPARRA